MTEYAPILVGADQPIPNEGFGEPGIIVGADPLTHRDGDTAYVQTYNLGGSGSSIVSFRLPDGASARPGARVSITVEARQVDNDGAILIYARPPGTSGAILTSGGLSIGPEGDLSYGVHTAEVDFTTVPDAYGPEHIINPDAIWYLENSTPTGEASSVRTTWLRVIVEDETYLRNHARDDGLGANPPRNRQVTSQQRSLRNRSYR